PTARAACAESAQKNSPFFTDFALCEGEPRVTIRGQRVILHQKLSIYHNYFSAFFLKPSGLSSLQRLSSLEKAALC
ncbi:MAG: hypothetical protein ABSA59_17305, partial [Terriglobia bacterium]